MLLSIIIPVYNTELFLCRCLTSLVEQIDKNVEIICIDDGSSDDSGIICNKFAEKYDCVKVYHKPNEGVSSARNMALSHASGEYIAWVDSDDYVADEWYQSLKPLLEQDIDLIFFEHYRIENGILRQMRYAKDSKMIDKNKFIYDLVMDTKLRNYLCDKVFKRSLFERILFPTDISLMEDYSILHKVCYRAETIYYLAKPLYFYVIRSDSISHAIDFQKQFQGIKIAKMRYDWLSERHMKISRFGYLKHCMDFLFSVLRQGKENTWKKEFIACRREICKYIGVLLLSQDISIKYKVKYCMVYLNIWQPICKIWFKVHGGGTSDSAEYCSLHDIWRGWASESVRAC